MLVSKVRKFRISFFLILIFRWLPSKNNYQERHNNDYYDYDYDKSHGSSLRGYLFCMFVFRLSNVFTGHTVPTVIGFNVGLSCFYSLATVRAREILRAFLCF